MSIPQNDPEGCLKDGINNGSPKYVNGCKQGYICAHIHAQMNEQTGEATANSSFCQLIIVVVKTVGTIDMWVSEAKEVD